ncbi:nucleoside-diphosphate-sugar epimerase [Pedobacter ginsengisoli]|uniref:Nucleoside-diphosphate-sugar epimerase n=1 Tax=Pedobacter ginsengisoli TaxID=363852 RepID=A0A2D1U8L9_9SPHI|nr:NAD-dependent epimerase/dehydratase family protein [Pedobacter ginsengisoli]ATP57951.1 nucleoside-diphosphate-sugar epimerase [Pedobacter ginsengisoli]
MSNILISGIKGFVGSNLSSYLKNNKYVVSGLGRRQLDQNLKDYSEFTWDDLSLIKEKEFCAIIHLAGKAHDLKKTANDDEYFKVNTDLTKLLFDLFLQSEIKDFIYFSSVKAVADKVDGILKEDVIPSPYTPYGQSKLQAESYLLSKSLPAEKRLFIIRPCMIHGPGNKGNLNLLYKVVKKGIPYPLAGFENQRSFLSIHNLNFIIEKVISNQDIAGGIYNVADDEALSTNDVIKIIADADGKEARLWKINSGIIKTFASIGDKLGLPLNSERLKKLTESYVVSNDKIKHALKIENLPTSSREGLLTTIKSFRSS